MKPVLRMNGRPCWPGDLLALAAGLLLPLAFSPFDVYPVAILSPALLFLSWQGMVPRRAMLRGALFGLGMFGAGVSWIFVSIHEHGHVPWGLSILLTVLFVLVLSVFPALAGWLAIRLERHCGSLSSTLALVLIYPAVWVLMEWVRGWFLTGFPWLNLGYSQIDAPLAGLAPLFGVYGVSYFTVLSAALLLGALVHRGGVIIGPYLVTFVALWVGAGFLSTIHWTRSDASPLKVSLVQGNIPQDLKWQPAMREVTVDLYSRLSRHHWDSSLIIWPETAMPMFYRQALPYLETLEGEARSHQTELLVGLIYQDPEKQQYFNSMVTVGGKTAFYHKQHLVPFTEYLPFATVLGDVVDLLDVPMSDFSPGSTTQPPLELAGQPVAVSICYEDAFGEEVIRALPQATLLVNVSNDAWFAGSIAPAQHMQIARMRALETGRFLLRATNTGVSAIVDPRGDIQAAAPPFREHVLSASVQPMAGATPYVRLGNYPAVLFPTLLLVVFVALERRAKSK